jgi:cysteine desulfurase
LEEHWAPGFQPYKLSQDLLAALDIRYQMIYDLAGASLEDTFVFTSSGAEAVNQVHWTAFLELARKEGKCHFITTSAEDAPLLQSLKRLEDLGCFVKLAPLDSMGQVDIPKLKELISPRTAMISLSYAHGLTGVIQPIEEIAALAKEKKVLLHADATYAIGKVYCPFQELDYLTFSGDRLHATKGSGGLFAKAGRPLQPLIIGGIEQGGFRGGAFDIPSFMALSAAASQASLSLDLMGLETARLRDRLEEQLLAKIAGATVLFSQAPRLPNTSVISIPRVHQEALFYALCRKQLFASIGGQYAPHLARHLMAAGIDAKIAETAIHFSLSRTTTQDEIDRAIAIIVETVQQLRSLSEDLFS